MHVLILGATSAIAAEAARLYAARGDRLHLVGRDAEKLARVAASCAPAVVTTAQADFADLAQNEAVIAAAFAGLVAVFSISGLPPELRHVDFRTGNRFVAIVADQLVQSKQISNDFACGVAINQ